MKNVIEKKTAKRGLAFEATVENIDSIRGNLPPGWLMHFVNFPVKSEPQQSFDFYKVNSTPRESFSCRSGTGNMIIILEDDVIHATPNQFEAWFHEIGVAKVVENDFKVVEFTFDKDTENFIVHFEDAGNGTTFVRKGDYAKWFWVKPSTPDDPLVLPGKPVDQSLADELEKAFENALNEKLESTHGQKEREVRPDQQNLVDFELSLRELINTHIAKGLTVAALTGILDLYKTRLQLDLLNHIGLKFSTKN